MVGLRTQESKKFNTFFELVQNKAQARGAVFFLESGDGNEFETEAMEGEELQGWLIPEEKASEFDKIWREWKENDEWVDFFCWVEWSRNGNSVDVSFVAA